MRSDPSLEEALRYIEKECEAYNCTGFARDVVDDTPVCATHARVFRQEGDQ